MWMHISLIHYASLYQRVVEIVDLVWPGRPHRPRLLRFPCQVTSFQEERVACIHINQRYLDHSAKNLSLFLSSPLARILIVTCFFFLMVSFLPHLFGSGIFAQHALTLVGCIAVKVGMPIRFLDITSLTSRGPFKAIHV